MIGKDDNFLDSLRKQALTARNVRPLKAGELGITIVKQL